MVLSILSSMLLTAEAGSGVARIRAARRGRVNFIRKACADLFPLAIGSR